MILNIKENINKIDRDLKELFENVYISEVTDRNNYLFSIKANQMFLFENCRKRIEVDVLINKENLKTNTITWSYSTNPLNENADRIERVSLINNIANDMYDVASNKRMVKEYFENLEEHVEAINENEEVKEKTLEEKLDDLLKKYNLGEKTILGDDIIAYSKNELKMSDKFIIEKDLLNLGFVNYVSYSDNKVKINLNLN